MEDRPATHYATLKVAHDAPPEVIRAAYRALSQKHHPDLHPEDIHAERTMQVINAAYEVLSDPLRRREYDRWVARRGDAPGHASTRASPAGSTGPEPEPVHPSWSRSAARGGAGRRRVRAWAGALFGLMAIVGAATFVAMWAGRGSSTAAAPALVAASASAAPVVQAPAPISSPVPLPPDTTDAKPERARAWWEGIGGAFIGQLESAGVATAVETAWPQVQGVPFDGSYRYLEHGHAVAGILSECRPYGVEVILCDWRDPFGRGRVRFAFDEPLASFTARWGSGNASPSHAWTGRRS